MLGALLVEEEEEDACAKTQKIPLQSNDLILAGTGIHGAVKTWLVWSLLLLLEGRRACGVSHRGSAQSECLRAAQWAFILMMGLSLGVSSGITKKYVVSSQTRATLNFLDGEKRPSSCLRMGLVRCPSAWMSIF